MQVMDTGKHRAQHFVAAVEVVHIGTREAPANRAIGVGYPLAGIARAGFVDGT